MNANERADAIIQDILTNHLPRVVEGLKAGYVDENQVLVIYDHAVRARILKEFAEAQPALEHTDNLARLNRELEAEWKAELMEQREGKVVGDIPHSFVHPGEKEQDRLAMHGPTKTVLVNMPAPGIPCGVLKQVEVPCSKDEIETMMAVVSGRNTVSGHEHFVGGISKDGLPEFTDDKGRALLHPINVANDLAKEWTRRYADMHFTAETVREAIRKPAVAADKSYGFVLDKEPYASRKRIQTGADLRKLLPKGKEGYAIYQEVLGSTDPDIQIKDDTTWDGEKNPVFYSVPPATFGRGSDTCACGGLIKEYPTSVEALLKCERCERVYTDEHEVIEVRNTEKISPTKVADATYWTTGTLAGGNSAVPMETQINLNGRKTTIKAKDGKFVLTYEEIVRMAVNQRRGHLNAFTGSDADLPHETVVYHHRVPFNQLPGERDGSLWKGKSVECTPGMCIDCCNTGNA